MSVSSTEGKTFYGIVVGGYDSIVYGSKSKLDIKTGKIESPKDSVDPYGMGRVKVLCPSLHHIKTSYTDLPWCYMASDPSGFGAYSFNRPPPPGSMVEVYFPGGSKATGQGIIRSVINGAHNTNATGASGSTINPISGGRGENLAEDKKGYIYKARNTTSKTISGPARRDSKKGVRYNKYPTMAMRESFDNSLASKATIMLLKPTYSIFSADQYEGFSFPGGTGGGESIVFREHGDYLWRMCMVDPFLAKAVKSFAINIASGYDSPASPRNFASLGGKGNVVAWRRAARLKLLQAKDLKTLNDVLHEIMTEKFIYGEGMTCGDAAQGDISWVMDPTKYSYPPPEDGQVASVMNPDPDLVKAMAHNQKDLIEQKCEPLSGISGGGSTPFGKITANFSNSGKCQGADAGEIGNKKADYLKEKFWKVPAARCGLKGASFNKEGKLEDPKGLLKDDSGLIDTMLKLPESMQEEMKKILDDVKDLKIHIEFCRFMTNEEGITRGAPEDGKSIAGAS